MAQHYDDEERGLAVIDAAGVPARAPTQQMGMLRPLVDAETARQAIDQYEELKRAIVRPDDIQMIQGREFLKKPFWRRIATCFGLSVELVREERLLLDDKLAYRVVYRAVAPNGRWMDGDGMFTYGEKGQTIEHNIRAIAHTRAKNRAISDLVGGGEVSAEEMPEEDTGPRDRSDREERGARRTAQREKGATQRDRSATEIQLNRIAKACGLLGRPVPEIHGYDHAATVIAALEQEYREKRDREQQVTSAAPVVDGDTQFTFDVEEQPAAAAPDLADLPMARGGVH